MHSVKMLPSLSFLSAISEQKSELLQKVLWPSIHCCSNATALEYLFQSTGVPEKNLQSASGICLFMFHIAHGNLIKQLIYLFDA